MSGIKNHEERKIVGHTDGEGVSLGMQRADVKKVLDSARKMNMGGIAVVLDEDKSYRQKREANETTRISYEQGPRATYVWVPAKEREVAKETETEMALKGNRFAILATESEVHQDFIRRA